jgi:hypothetical protein
VSGATVGRSGRGRRQADASSDASASL